MKARVKPEVWTAWCAAGGIDGHPTHDYQDIIETDRVGNVWLAWPPWWWKPEEVEYLWVDAAPVPMSAEEARQRRPGFKEVAPSPEFWHGKEVVVLYAIVANVNDRTHTFYVASEHRSGVEPEVRIAEQDRLAQKWRGILNTKNVVITAFRWVPV